MHAEATKPWYREPTRAQWYGFGAAWLGWVLDAFDFTIFVLVMPQIAAEFGVSPVALNGSLMLTLLVRLCGGWVGGWLADRWGRRLPLMLSLVWFAIFDGAIYFAASFEVIVVLRTLFGFGMGAEWTAGTALAMESWPQRTKKIASGLLQAGWPVGFFLAALTAKLVEPVAGWRVLFLIAAAPALLTIPIRLLVPDSKPHAAPAHNEARPTLRSKKILTNIAIGSFVMSLGFVVYYGLVANAGFLLRNELHLSAPDAFDQQMLFQVGMLVGVVATGWIANRWGIITALLVPSLAMLPAVPLYIGVAPSLLWLGSFAGGALGVGYSGITAALLTGLFPAEVRARCIGIVYHVGALAAAITGIFVAYLDEQTTLTLGDAIALVVSCGLVGMAAAVWFFRRRLVPDDQLAQPQHGAGVSAAPAQTPVVREANHA